MDGLNRRFKSNTAAFLAATPITLGFEGYGGVAPPLGLVTFDLKPHARFPEIAVLDLMATRGKVETLRTRRIRAHWLPWQASGTTSIQLDGTADYFFTSQVAGCRVVVIPAPARRIGTNHPRVLHIAGNAQLPVGDDNGSHWRTQSMLANTTLAEQGRARSLSSTTPMIALAPVPLGYRGEGVNVVGFIKNMAWQFWGQQTDLNPQPAVVTRCWRIH
jgi:hypothetical protein